MNLILMINLFLYINGLDPVLTLGSLAFVLILISLPFSFWNVGENSNSSIVRILIASANILLAIQLVFRWIQSGHFPISNLYESLCFLTWGLTFIQLLIERTFPYPLIQAALTPISLLSIAFASFVLPDELKASSSLVPALKSNWLVMHVSVIMCSYAALLIGSLLSLVVLLSSSRETLQIRSNSMGIGGFKNKSENLNIVKSIDELIPITFSKSEELDNLSYRTITFGFLLLTFGLISGAVWANEAWGSWWSWDPKETWAFISWLIYAAYLHTRLSRGWQGKRPAIIAIIGLFIILICYIGVNFLGIGLHSYGWFL
ncbi:Cytochrome c-type bioproteinsis protein CcsA/ResC [Prochlorococcus marinus str. SS35]|uniref:Cytochrome c biogenesis protein CcsA n=2 Tax=Prochlorococcaceae TaxID=2881426 RepID=CCSA_PROMA|nr:RecName: Full=Cytochrome c biogenesis protein CcsA [Prochlorococcus marinus subsp. marinus str. CCMP1375]AAP99882.1 ABC-type transport system involved in cytochrome c biogenesis permease component [Prochlorococcus marinus subsp. marinus str. CCMP1375]KGG23647.1 Cytochrome c-type bioproteinsis protein CcsA/ResC [Prochlorococcus marinus str. SS35]